MIKRLLVVALLSLGFALLLNFASVLVRYGFATHAVTTDYVNILLGATLICQGHGNAADLYNIALQTSVQQHIINGVGHFPDGLLPFISPPLVAILNVPFAQLPVGIAFVLRNATQLLILLFAIWLLRPLLPTEHRYLLWLGAFAFMPVQELFDKGQISAMLLLSIALLWRGLRAGGGDWQAIIGLSLCLLKPQLLPIFLLYVLYKRRWRIFAGFSVVAALWYAVCAAVTGLDWPLAYLAMVNLVGSQSNHYSIYPDRMFSLRSLLARFDADSTLLVLVVSGLAIAALFYAWWRSDHYTNPEPLQNVGTLELQLAATTLAALLVGVYLYSHDLTVLLFCGAVALGWAAQHRWPAWMTVLLLAGLFTPITALNGPPFDGIIIVVMIAALVVFLNLLIQPQPALRPAREPAA